MSEEIKINKHSGSISFTNNGISFSQFGIAKEILSLITNLQQRVEQLEKIIKEAMEYVKKNLTIGSILDGKKTYCLNSYSFDYEDLLNILNKGSDKK